MIRRPSRRALVADDDADVAKVVATNLRSDGFAVEVVSNGWAAQTRALNTGPDLIVLDVTMPGRTGLEVLRSLRGHPLTSRIPVVLLTARSSDDEIWEGWKAGAASYVTKPFDVDELLRCVRNLLQTPAV